MTLKRTQTGTALALILTSCSATMAAAQSAPGAPTNLQATVNNLSLTWGAPASGGAPTSYTLVARATSGGAVLGTVPLGNVTSFAGVGPNGVFVVSRVATNAAGTGPESTAVTVTLPTLPAPPGAPSNLVASVLGNTATFSWTAPSSGGVVANYLLVAGLTPGFAVPLGSLPLPASATSTGIPGIPPGTYYVRVLAQNAGGTSAATNEVPLTIAGPSAPGAPTLNAPTVTGSTVGLSWTPGAGGTPTSYVLTALTAGGAVLGNVPLIGTSASFPGVPDGIYGLRIVAVNSLGTSPASNLVTLTLPAPTGPIQQIGSDILSPDLSFGSNLALSANDGRIVVSAYATASGTTRVYERSGGTWTQIGADIIGEASGDRAGTGVDINAAGTRVAIGAYLNDGGGGSSGHVRVYDLVGATWTQVGADLDGDGASWALGWSVALSASGNRLIAGGPGNGGTTGRVKFYELVSGTWTQLGVTLTAGHEFGDAVDISSDGTTIAVSSPSAAGSSRAGTAQVFRLSAGAWTQVGNTYDDVEAITDGRSAGTHSGPVQRHDGRGRVHPAPHEPAQWQQPERHLGRPPWAATCWARCRFGHVTSPLRRPDRFARSRVRHIAKTALAPQLQGLSRPPGYAASTVSLGTARQTVRNSGARRIGSSPQSITRTAADGSWRSIATRSHLAASVGRFSCA